MNNNEATKYVIVYSTNVIELNASIDFYFTCNCLNLWSSDINNACEFKNRYEAETIINIWNLDIDKEKIEIISIYSPAPGTKNIRGGDI